MSAPGLVAGQIVGGRFTIHRERARTGLTATYEAITAPNRAVELKLLSPTLRQRADLDDCMQRTMRATNELPSSLALQVVDMGIDHDTGAPFLVTEPSVTPSLAELVQLCPLAPGEVVTFVRNLALALDPVHARGLAHLMLAPDNVFVGAPPRFEVRLADVGVSLLLGPAGADPRWAAPELGTRPHIACDVYAAALVTLFAASGAVLNDRSEAAMRAPATTVGRETGNAVDARLDAPLARALAFDPAHRYGSVLELAEAVAQAFGVAWAEPPAPSALRLEAAQPVAAETQSADAVVAEWGLPAPVASEIAMPGHDLFGGAPVHSPMAGDSMQPDALAAGLPARPKSLRIALVASAIGVTLGAVAVAGWTITHRRGPVVAVAPSASSRPVAAGPASATPSATPPPKAMPGVIAPTATAAGAAPPPTAPVVAPAAAAGGTARLTVTCTPECDVITVDGNAVASFPTAFAAGEHAVVARRGLHPPQTKKVVLADGNEETVAFVFFGSKPAPKKPCGKFLQRCD